MNSIEEREYTAVFATTTYETRVFRYRHDYGMPLTKAQAASMIQHPNCRVCEPVNATARITHLIHETIINQ